MMLAQAKHQVAHMPALTLAQAAEACGINRSTVLRALKRGRISGQRDDTGAWSVEPCELFRIFPAQAVAEAVPQSAEGAGELRLRLALAEERLGELRHMLEDMRGQRDRWQVQAEKLLLAPPMPAPKPARRSFLRFLAGG
jgi:hypothetical protein